MKFQTMLNKVPEVTIYFWVIKVLATTVGETAADFLSTALHLGLVRTSYVMSGLFVIALLVQLSLKKYVPAAYWVVVVLMSVVGTLVSDTLVDKLGMGLSTTSLIFGGALIVVFAVWWRNERTLSVHTIYTTRRELFYWAAILFTFALGTSAGDLAAEASGLGYALSALMFAGAIGLTSFAYYGLKINGVLAFWIAYILTRPLGASLGDLLSQTKAHGGLGLGTTLTSAIFLITILTLVTYLSITRRDVITTPEALEKAA
ncbi:MAG: membrane protein [Vulcanimicrobiaceae bacterium]